MSRLDAEYDPAERHDLDQIKHEPRDLSQAPWPWRAYCCCGWSDPWPRDTRVNARAAHDLHREDKGA